MKALSAQHRWAVAIIVVTLSGCGDTARSRDTEPAAATRAQSTDRLRVPTDGMAPTLHLGQIVTADLAAYRNRAPAIGDIVVFNPPVGAPDDRCGIAVPSGAACARPVDERNTSLKFVKRIVAGPGDKLKIIHGRVILAGERQPEPFAKRCGRLDQCHFCDGRT